MEGKGWRERMVHKKILDAGSIKTPVLDYYFKRVHVGLFRKEELDKARRRLFK